MTSPAAQDQEVLAEALRRVVASEGAALRPGQLRQRLEAALEPEQLQRLRPALHQVVAAAEENLPADLTRIAPLTVQSLQRLSGDLAQARGWSVQAAQRTTQIWATALGFADLAASSWPRPAPSTSPAPPNRPRVATGPLAGPQAAPQAGQAPTQLPPPSWRPSDPPPSSLSVPFPPSPRQFRDLTLTPDGEQALGVAKAYGGIHLFVLAGSLLVLTVVLCLPIILWGGVGFLLPLLGVLGAKGLVRLARYGVLAASASGVSFTPYAGAWRKPLPEQTVSAPWSAVRVRRGFVSEVRLGEQRVQLGPRNRAFASALATRLGGGR